MKIIVLSCDKNWDTFYPFHHCLEKFWPDHPEVIYKTEKIDNGYYKTIKADYHLEEWTKGVREFLGQIDDDQVLLMMDDIFIRKPVDTKRIEYASQHLKGNTACFNLELSFDATDMQTDMEGWKKRRNGAPWVVSIMCGLWDRKKLMAVLEPVSDPWEVEQLQNHRGFDYYINSGDYIIDWGYRSFSPPGISRGKWRRETVEFFRSQGICVNLSRGVW